MVIPDLASGLLHPWRWGCSLLSPLGIKITNQNRSDRAVIIKALFGCVCFFHLMLNRTFFELNAEYYLIALSIKLFVF